MNKRLLLLILFVLVDLGRPAHAHVGNKDVYEQITVKGYKLFITVRTPVVIPGIATIEVRSAGEPITSLELTPLLLTGEASKHPPTPDPMVASSADAQFFTGSVWLMQHGSWQIRFLIDGAHGPAVTSVPVLAAPDTILHMQRPLGILLTLLGIVLIAGMAGIVAGAIRESRLRPGLAPDPNLRRRAGIASAVTFALLALGVYGGGHWWNIEAADYTSGLYTASTLRPALSGNVLQLTIGAPDSNQPGNWASIKTSHLLPDHGHLMHLYAIRWPEMDAVFHLHPAPNGDDSLTETLPSMPAGDYRLFGDIVYSNGFAETLTTTLSVPARMSTAPLDAEDASASPAPLFAGELGPTYRLPDGYTMTWEKPTNIFASTPYAFRFTLFDPTGKPASHIQPYLGMAGHAAFVKCDGTTFAHTHPDGSAAMPALILAQQSTSGESGTVDPMDFMTAEQPTSKVEFPYGFPSSGRYRIFVQMKHDEKVETGVFDANVR